MLCSVIAAGGRSEACAGAAFSLGTGSALVSLGGAASSASAIPGRRRRAASVPHETRRKRLFRANGKIDSQGEDVRRWRERRHGERRKPGAVPLAKRPCPSRFFCRALQTRHV